MTNVTTGAELAKMILANARNDVSFLNWDGHTPRQDLLDNIQCYVSRITGWGTLSVTYADDQLRIETPQQQLLVYNVRYEREVYGRCRHVGFTLQHLQELNKLLTLQ